MTSEMTKKIKLIRKIGGGVKGGKRNHLAATRSLRNSSAFLTFNPSNDSHAYTIHSLTETKNISLTRSQKSDSLACRQEVTDRGCNALLGACIRLETNTAKNIIYKNSNISNNNILNTKQNLTR